jgi:thiol:disulfide interchange protein
MQTIRFIFSIAVLLVAAWIIWTFVQAYWREQGSTFDRLLGAAQESATILWSKFTVIVAAIVAQLGDIADLIGQPEWKDAINVWLGNPKVVAGVMLAISVITITARKRTL